MTTAGELRSGKGHRDENFPVASWLIDARHRGIILAFYEFVRVADDIADHATLKPDEKLAQLDRLEQNLLGQGDDNAEAVRLRTALAERGLAAAPRAGPAHRVPHGRDQAALQGLGRSDPLLQLLGDAGRALRARCARRKPRHLGGERCALRRAADQQSPAGLRQGFPRSQSRLHPARCIRGGGCRRPEELGASRASPKLLRCIHDLAARNELLLAQGEPFSAQIENTRLALEVAVIHSYARHIVALLQARDPLSERVHLSKAQFALYGLSAVIINSLRRIGRARPVRKPQDAQHKV